MTDQATSVRDRARELLKGVIDPKTEENIREVRSGWDDVSNGVARELAERVRHLEGAISWIVTTALGLANEAPGLNHPAVAFMAELRNEEAAYLAELKRENVELRHEAGSEPEDERPEDVRANETPDPRFTMGLLVDVLDALERHGYPRPTGGEDLVRLELALFRYLYRKGG